jgi:hypothetical protein
VPITSSINLRSAENNGATIWANTSILDATNLRDEQHKPMRLKVWQGGLAAKLSGTREGEPVLTMGFAYYMLDKLYQLLCQRDLECPHTVGPERGLTLELMMGFQKLIETTPVVPHRITIKGRPYAPRTILNIDGEPNWVARDVFAALKLKDRGASVAKRIPNQFKFVEPLHHHAGARPKRDLCLTWAGLDMALGLIKTPAALEFDSWVRSEFGGRFPELFRQERKWDL